MPSSVRPKGSGSGNRAPPVTPMSERQQMALLMQMTSSGNEVGSRSPSSSSSRSRDRNERGETPLHLAAIKGDVEQVCKLLAHRADPNVADFAGWTPLHEACNHGWYEVAFRLVQSGANVNAKGLDNDTPLHDAAVNGHLKLVKLLVERGADIHAKNSKGKTPLDVAPAAVKPYLLNANLPLPETPASTRPQPRSRDDKKAADSSKQKGTATAQDETMDSKSSTSAEDVYEFKSVKDGDSSPDQKGTDAQDTDTEATDPLSIATPQSEDTLKRNVGDLAENSEEGTGNDEETRRKKRKDETAKEGKSAAQRGAGQTKGQSGKQSGGGQNKSATSNSAKGTGDKKSPCSSPKPAGTDGESEDGKTDLKVPPLKIVIPQTTSSEQEPGAGRNGKNNSQRTHQALPYVVPSSNSSEPSDKEPGAGSASPETSSAAKGEDKKDAAGSGSSEERGGSSHQRILRSSHRSGTTQATDRGSNNSSPQLQRSHSPSPEVTAQPQNQADPPAPTTVQTNATSKSSDSQTQQNNETETTASTSSAAATTSAPLPVELHPRKRKMKQNREPPASQPEPEEAPPETQVHPHEQPITNCYQLYLDIRNQINKRRRGLIPVQPKPPHSFKNYLMVKCSYVLAGTTPTSPTITYPPNLPPQMKDLFAEQEKERYRLQTQHMIEKERLVLSVEQDILRVHGKAARILVNQTQQFSACTILRDEEVYNFITPEQDEEKDRNARFRYNGRLFFGWLQDVDDKWDKVKEHMLLRHHNEADSLHAVHKMNWEWKMKELNLCDRKSTPVIDESHIPAVQVDDFNILPG